MNAFQQVLVLSLLSSCIPPAKQAATALPISTVSSCFCSYFKASIASPLPQTPAPSPLHRTQQELHNPPLPGLDLGANVHAEAKTHPLAVNQQVGAGCAFKPAA
jgi:hypothetical protein